MPPKKEDTPPSATVSDAGIYGAFVTISVPEAHLSLVSLPDGSPAVSQVQLLLSSPGGFAPLKSEPKEGQSGSFSFNFKYAFRQGTSLKALDRLIQPGAVRLSLHDVASGAMLAHADLDMAPLALGSTAWEVSRLVMEAVPGGSIASGCTIKALEGIFPSISVALSARLPPEGMSPEEAEAAVGSPPEGFEETLPWRYFEDDREAEGCNVLDLGISGFGPVPPGLVAASNAAQEGKAPGKLTISLALILPPSDSEAVTVSGGSVLADGVALGPRVRRLLSRVQTEALRAHLEDGLPLSIEVARYLAHDSLIDPAWEHYHAAGSISGASGDASVLLRMGLTTTHAEEVALMAFGPAGRPSVLPAYAPANSKAKAVEEPPSAGSEAIAIGAWKEASCHVTLSLSLLRPLVASWKPPPKATAPLSSLVPARPELRRYDPPDDAMQSYRKLVSQLGKSVKQMALDSVASGKIAVPTARSLMADLQSTGRYGAIRQALSEAAVRVALERYSKAHNAGCGAASPVGGAPTAKQVSALHEELSAVLDKELESALSIATGATPTERGSPGPMAERDGLAAAKGEEKGGSDSKVSSDLCHLLALAKENEQAGQLRRAEALHQRRVLILTSSKRDARGAWREYGAFCMRTGQLGRGEQCFREGLPAAAATAVQDRGAGGDGDGDGGANWKHGCQCGFALSAALLHQARVTDLLFLSEAERRAGDLLAASKSDADCGVARVLMALIQEASGHKEAANEAMAALLAHQTPAGSNPVLTAAADFLELGLPWLSVSALDYMRHSPSAGSLLEEIALVKAKALGQLGGPEAEAQALELLAALGQGSPEAQEALGHLHFNASRFVDAVRAYRVSIETSSPSEGAAGASYRPSSQLYLQLARAYGALGHPDWALQVYTLACAASPSASAWLGVAASRYALEDLDAAGQALSEAIGIDAESSVAWGWTALVALKSGRADEAASALKCAVGLGLDDASLLADLSREFAARGDQGGQTLAENLGRLIPASEVPCSI